MARFSVSMHAPPRLLDGFEAKKISRAWLPPPSPAWRKAHDLLIVTGNTERHQRFGVEASSPEEAAEST